jgi:hypothetical protein
MIVKKKMEKYYASKKPSRDSHPAMERYITGIYATGG